MSHLEDPVPKPAELLTFSFSGAFALQLWRDLFDAPFFVVGLVAATTGHRAGQL